RFRCLVAVLGLMVLTIAVERAGAQTNAVTLTPELVESGSPVLIHVDAGPGASFDGEWLGRKVLFFPARDGHGWFALAGVDVEAPAGPSTLKIVVHIGNGEQDLSRTVEIHPAHYRTGKLTVAAKFVEPDAEEQKQIEAESQLKARVFAASA